MIRSTALLACAAAALTLAGCAAEPAPAETVPAASAETATTEPEIQVGDTVTAEQAAELNSGTDLMKAYPVGDTFIAVQWGLPIPETVKTEVGVQVNAGVGPEHGKATQNIAAQQNALGDVLRRESDKLGGISVAAVQCVLSFSEQSNSYNPSWGVSSPGPGRLYGSEEEALAAADAWSQDGKKMYVVVNNLGC